MQAPLTGPALYRLGFANACGLTDIGPVRHRNEDNLLIDVTLGLAAVADGMGGHGNGDLASASALLALQQFLLDHQAFMQLPGGPALAGASPATSLPDHFHGLAGPGPTARPANLKHTGEDWSDPSMPAIGLLHHAIAHVNTRLYDMNLACGRGDGDGMGCTLTGIWRMPEPAQPSSSRRSLSKTREETPLLVFHVGDSRLYRWRIGELEQLTRDQSFCQQALDAGLSSHLAKSNLLLQAIGPAATVSPDIRAITAMPGDTLLLCSDGLHGPVPPAEIANVMAAVQELNLPDYCASLVKLAVQRGGRDNITALLLVCGVVSCPG